MANQRERQSGRIPFIRALVRAVWREFLEDNCVDLAAQTSFYFLLALFPFFIVLAALASYLSFTNVSRDLVLWIIHYFPPTSQHAVTEATLDLSRGRGGFLSLGLVTSAWAASTGIVSLIDALNVVYEVQEARSYWKRRALALGMLVGLCLSFLIAFGLLTSGGLIASWIEMHLHPGPYFHVLWQTVTWVASVVLLALGMSFVERAFPNAHLPWKWITAGGVFVVVMSILASMGFRIYIQHFTTYATAYGAFGSFFVLMLWVYMESLIILVAGEINSELGKMKGNRHNRSRVELE